MRSIYPYDRSPNYFHIMTNSSNYPSKHDLTKAELKEQRVEELRHVARSICGPGTWISHARKDELIEGIMQGHPPESMQATGRAPKQDYFERYAESSGDTSEEVEAVASALKALADKTVAHHIQRFHERIQRIEEELGLEADEESELDKIMDAMQKHSNASEMGEEDEEEVAA